MKPALLTRIASLMAATLLGLAACTSTVQETGRSQINFMAPGEESRLGLQEFQKYKQTKTVSSNRAYNEQVQRVAARLTRVIDLPGANWEFVVFEDSTPNAFALPGGKVGIHTGLFSVTRDDAGLAAVLGHEIAHLTARHAGERVSQTALRTGIATVVGGVIAEGAGIAPGTAYGVTSGAAGLSVLGFSRKQELEADQIGALYMARAGYDPRESVELWKRFAALKAARGDRNVALLSSHPLDDDRIRALEDFMPRALSEYGGALPPVGEGGTVSRARPMNSPAVAEGPIPGTAPPSLEAPRALRP